MATNNSVRIAECKSLIESLDTRRAELAEEMENLIAEDERNAQAQTAYENKLTIVLAAFNLVQTVADAGASKLTAIPYVEGMIVTEGLFYNVDGNCKTALNSGIDDISFADAD